MRDRKSIFNQTHTTWVCLKELNQYIHWLGLHNISYPAWVIISYHGVFYSPGTGEEVMREQVNYTALTIFFFFLETWKNIYGIIISLWIGRKLAWLKCMVPGGVVENEATEIGIEGILSVMPGNLYLVLLVPVRRQWKPFSIVMMWPGMMASCSSQVLIFGVLVWRYYFLFLFGLCPKHARWIELREIL